MQAIYFQIRMNFKTLLLFFREGGAFSGAWRWKNEVCKLLSFFEIRKNQGET
jgi:hypothetical protein